MFHTERSTAATRARLQGPPSLIVSTRCSRWALGFLLSLALPHMLPPRSRSNLPRCSALNFANPIQTGVRYNRISTTGDARTASKATTKPQTMKLRTYPRRCWNPVTQRFDTHIARALFVWRFCVWAYDRGARYWGIEIQVKGRPEILKLDKHGWLRHDLDWSRYWQIQVGLGKVGISYDDNAHRRDRWEMRHKWAGLWAS